ncbi:MAG: 30S ribosomal protein S4e [Candidatus Thermoplasmatota archaeon]|nr:30S ribosomal protein S4e [Candidatus Thermoplasmatota archaeon]
MSKHLKRLNAPKSLRLHRKERKWTVKPSPGPHPMHSAIPLGLVARDYLNICDTLREAKRVIANGEILVDMVKRKDYKFACGFMDIISIPKLEKQYRILFDQSGKLVLVPISLKETEWKLCRIEDKTIIRGKQTQLNLHDGKNKLVKKDEYKTGDVLKLSLKDKKISDVYPLAKGSVSMIIGGSHIGQMADIQELEIIPSSKSNIAKMKGVNEFSTHQEYVFPIGKTKPVISLPEVMMQ